MSLRTLRWTQLARRRLDQIGGAIARDNREAAERVVVRLISAAHALASQPAMGRTGRIRGTRELALADIPYIVAYRVTQTHVDILTLMHSAQQWPDEL
ncbi:MAG: addiction module toxin, RelE/StbE family [Hyphomicrobiales bacterium]|jgi:addiction module RelE/StbE family toxin|nr:addiction module toxin, RelE/StbE family [Hyphomicrobiales bacterium]